VRADHDVDVADVDALGDPLRLPRGEEPGQHLDPYRVVGEAIGEGLEVLLRQQGRLTDGSVPPELTLTDLCRFDEVLGRLGDRAVQADRERLTISVPSDGDAAAVRTLMDLADPTRAAIREFAVQSATLDDVFHALTGRRAVRPESEKSLV